MSPLPGYQRPHSPGQPGTRTGASPAGKGDGGVFGVAKEGHYVRAAPWSIVPGLRGDGFLRMMAAPAAGTRITPARTPAFPW